VSAGQADGQRPATARFGEAAEHVGRAAARGDADDAILRADVQGGDVLSAGGGVIFGAFHGGGDGPRPARDEGDDEFRRGAEGGRTFRRIEDPQPSRRPRADVDQPSARLHALRDGVNRGGDVRQFLRDSLRNAPILSVDHAHHLQRGDKVNIHGRRIARFGEGGGVWLLIVHARSLAL